MTTRKQVLLKRYRSHKRIGLMCFLLLLIVLAVFLPWFYSVLAVIVLFVVNEAWFSDHQFYCSQTDYAYCFSEQAQAYAATLENGQLKLSLTEPLDSTDTLILEVNLKSNYLGYLFDPTIQLSANQKKDEQCVERGCRGKRFINLTGWAEAISQQQLNLQCRLVQIVGEMRLWKIAHPNYLQETVLVIAPHADDAELAAFGFYKHAKESWVVTVTAGEIENEAYQKMGLSREQAATLKGRLRAWDSIAVPRWAGIPNEQALQLGYFCLQLESMAKEPSISQGSRDGNLKDTRIFRQMNPFRLASDKDGEPTWCNLVQDLQELCLKIRPSVIVMPHPILDPHPDHQLSYRAMQQALAQIDYRPKYQLLYANHLHDNTRWPMGKVHMGVTLPPIFEREQYFTQPWSLALDHATQLDKAMALAMMHDLQPPLSYKKRLRRLLQKILLGRRWPDQYGQDEYFRRAVRNHELFWLKNEEFKN